MNKNSKGVASLLVIIILSLAVAGGIVYYAYKNGQIKTNLDQDKTKYSPSVYPTPDWKTYDNTYGYNFNYPANWYIIYPSGSYVRIATSQQEDFNYGKLPDKNAQITFDVLYKNEKFTLDNWVEGISKSYPFRTISSKKNLEIGRENIMLTFSENNTKTRGQILYIPIFPNQVRIL